MSAGWPRARRDDLLVQRALDELLVYDTRSHEAHCLSPVAAAIWQACDGRSAVEVLAVRVRDETGLPCDEQVLWQAIEELRARSLLDVAPAPPPGVVSRRALLHAGLAVPLITSIIAPTPAAAQSGSGSQGPQGPQGFQGVQGPQGPAG